MLNRLMASTVRLNTSVMEQQYIRKEDPTGQCCIDLLLGVMEWAFGPSGQVCARMIAVEDVVLNMA